MFFDLPQNPYTFTFSPTSLSIWKRAWTGMDVFYALDVVKLKSYLRCKQMTILSSHSNEIFFASSIWLASGYCRNFRRRCRWWESEQSSSLPGCSWVWFKIKILSGMQTPSLIQMTIISSHSNQFFFGFIHSVGLRIRDIVEFSTLDSCRWESERSSSLPAVLDFQMTILSSHSKDFFLLHPVGWPHNNCRVLDA